MPCFTFVMIFLSLAHSKKRHIGKISALLLTQEEDDFQAFLHPVTKHEIKSKTNIFLSDCNFPDNPPPPTGETFSKTLYLDVNILLKYCLKNSTHLIVLTHRVL